MAKSQAKAKAKPKQDMLELAAIVSERVEMQDVRTLDAKWRLLPSAEHGKQELSFDTHVTVKPQKDSGHILVFPTFKMSGVSEGSSQKEKSLVVEATLLLIYKINDFAGIKKENLDAFGEINGVYNGWPYWREFVQNAIARMGLPKLTIPVFRLTGPGEQEKKKVTKKKKKSTKTKTKKKKMSRNRSE